MAQITLGGNPATTIGTIPETGTKAPDFNLTAAAVRLKSGAFVPVSGIVPIVVAGFPPRVI